MDTLGIENFISVKATEGPKLAAALAKQEAELKMKLGCEKVSFKVVVQDGKVKLKAAAINHIDIWNRMGATGVAMIGWSAWQLLGKVPAALQVKDAKAATGAVADPL